MKNKWSEMLSDGELVITDQETPFNWSNQLYNRKGNFYTWVDQNGVGKVQFNYERNEVAQGRNYLVTNGGETWSLNGGEAPNRAARSLVRQRPGISVFESEHNGIASSLSVAIDPDEYIEANLLTLTNKGDKSQELLITGCYFIRLLGMDNSQQLDRTAWHPEDSMLTLRRYHSESAHNYYSAFYTTDVQAESWCGSREDFLGGDRVFARAVAFANETLPPAHACATIPIFALRHRLTLAPGQSASISYTAGIADSIEDAIAAGRKSRGTAAKICERAVEYYRQVLDCGSIDVPDESLKIAYNC